ncbi:MAG: peptidoglycan D,D-transpeptidase FtsI family protein [Gaiellaceae bacterium]|jgi:penicillin-binding protein A|nr:penicillin-binding protein 2 [Acidobacteriota bacterium]
MNRQVAHVGVAALVLLTALIVATTYWQTWANAGLAERQDNAIRLVAQFSIKRGTIYAADHRTVLARNVVKKVDGQKLYFRRYPTGPLFSAAVGYSTQSRNQTGLERAYNDFLTGSNSNLDTVFGTTLDKLKGTTIRGNDLVLSLRPNAQAIALRALRGKCGAVVAMNPSTGAVQVLASSPAYNPNLVEKHFNVALHQGGKCGALVDRATAGRYQPGSTFKVVTAAAALDTGRYTPDSGFYDPGYCEEYGQRVRNAGNPEAPETFGSVSLFTGLEHSINSVFCNIGKTIGAATILGYAKRFGFYQLPPVELPENERAASGLYSHGRLFDPKNPATQVDPGRLAFGQERLQVTPLQMAMVASAVANHGLLMRPYLVQRVVAPGGKTIVRTKPHKLSRVMKPQVAAELNSMMQAVVTGGTGTAAQISGVPVAGKTGTAETGVGNIYTAWFIAFAPADHPKVAVAVVVENQPGGFGGKVSAPIAKQVMEALLR